MSSCTNRIAVLNNFFSLICSQPRDKQNRGRDFLLFKYFLNNLVLTVFIQNTLSKLVELLRLCATQNTLQLHSFFFLFRIPSAVFGQIAKSFLANVLKLFSLEACDQDPTHSLDTPKNISVKIVPEVVIRDACGT